MKKFVAITLALIICLSAVSSLAYVNGDVIGYACYTDIVAKINGYELESYNVDGYTYIIATDLRNYGFDVIWDESARTVTINRSTKYVTAAPDFNHAFVPQSMVGQKSYDLLYTDITTFVNGFEVPSYNINGRTIIRFDTLSEFGSSIWHPEQKTVSIYVGNLAGKISDAGKLAAKKTFIAKAKSIKINQEYLGGSATMNSGIYSATRNIYTDWNNLVYEMYAYLGTVMPANDFERLEKDQQLWASKKDAAMNAEQGAKGDVAAFSVGSYYLEDRCYYLTSLIDADVN